MSELATVVHRVAVLLGAGVAPAAAWRHAGHGTALEDWAQEAARSEPDGVSDQLARRPAAVHPRGWPGAARRSTEQAEHAGLAATWGVAIEAGAPLAGALRSYAELLRGFAEADRAALVALSGPRATSRLVLVLPALGLILGPVLGQDVIGLLIATPLGWSCLGLGTGLMAAAWAWNRALLRGAAAGDRLPGLVAELVAIAMRGGVSATRARGIVEAAAARHGIAGDFRTVEAAMRVATAAGAPVGELLRAEAEEARRAALAAAAARSERLAVALMLPLGVCVLPAFLVLGVVPVLAGIVTSTIATI